MITALTALLVLISLGFSCNQFENSTEVQEGTKLIIAASASFIICIVKTIISKLLNKQNKLIL
jgi:hypothetical protein